MVTATTNFVSAVFHLQRVVQNDLKLRKVTRESRIYYREQKTEALNELSKYEFLFSNNYHRLTECGSLVTYPDLGNNTANEIYISGLISGKSFTETYQEISKAFDRMLREAQEDPTGSRPLIAAYEKDVIQVYNDFGSGCVDIIRNNYGNPGETSNQINKFQTQLMKSARKMLTKQVPRFWQQGITWAEINLQLLKKGKKKEADVYIPANQDAIDLLIERNLGFITGMIDDVKKDILAELSEGLIRGDGIDQLIKRLAPYVDASTGKGQSRAELIARTEVMYGLNQGTITRYKRDGIKKVQWLAGPDDRMCPICGEKNGSVYLVGSEPSLPYHPNCRCCWIPYFDDMLTDVIYQNPNQSLGIDDMEYGEFIKRGYNDEEARALDDYKGVEYGRINRSLIDGECK